MIHHRQASWSWPTDLVGHGEDIEAFDPLQEGSQVGLGVKFKDLGTDQRDVGGCLEGLEKRTYAEGTTC